MNRRALDRSLDYVDSWLAWRCPREGIPGCVVAVAWRGRLLFAGAYGHADVEARRRLRPEHIFRIASHSKTFTATAILQLAERKALHLDDPVVLHLDWLRRHRDRRWRHVTLRQLLSHGAGVVRDGLDADYWQLGRRFPDAESLREEVLEADLVLEPNTAMKYSNFGYGLLGLVVEAASATGYGEYVDEHICGALGLRATVAEPERPPTSRFVTGYARRDASGNRPAIPPVATGALAPATGFASTAEDLCTYFDAHVVGSKKLLSDASKREMQRVQWHAHRPGPGLQQDYGLGLQLESVNDHATFGHSGGFPGQSTRTFADPAERLVVTVLTNCIDGPASEIGRGVLRVIDRFQAMAGEPARRGTQVLEGRYCFLWGVADLVAAGATMLVADPNSWDPFADPDTLERVGPTTLVVKDASSYGNPGELVQFRVEDGEVLEARWTGFTMWPEKRWAAAERRLLRRR